MKTVKLLSLGIALALSTLPAHLHAKAARAGMGACAEAIEAELSADAGNPVGVRLDPQTRAYGRMYKREVFHLDARNKETDGVVARFDCIVSDRAKVLELIPVPLSAGDARDRARGIN